MDNEKPPILFTFPGSSGDHGRYELFDQENYYKKFPGGLVRFFVDSVEHRLNGDLLSFMDSCEEVFLQSYREISQLITTEHYTLDRREFMRRCFDIWRYTTTLFEGHSYKDYKISKTIKSRGNKQVTFLLT